MRTNQAIRRRSAAIVLAVVLAWPFMAAAQGLSEEDELAQVFGDQVTISLATGSKQSLRRAPAVATVITAEEIAAMGASELDEVLEAVPGLHVTRTAGYMSSYVVRGLFGGQSNPQVLLLQNGVSLSSLYRGDKGGNWGGLPVESIARIEIIRGPGSALYGADAFAGVINIITKTAADMPGTVAGWRTGSFGTWSAWTQHGGQWGALDVATYLRIGATEGQRRVVEADAQSARDLRFGTSASLAPGSVNTGHDAVDAGIDLGYEKWRMQAYYKLRSDVGNGAGINLSLDPVGRGYNERITADLSWNDPHFSEHWNVGYTASFSHETTAMDTPLLMSPPGSQFSVTSVFPDGLIGDPGRKERQLHLSSHATYSGFANQQIRLGLGHDDLDLYATSTHKNYLLNINGVPLPTAFMDYQDIQPHILPQRRRLNYVYVQDEWNFARDWTLTAGARYDHFSDVGGTSNPRLALVWDATLDLTAKLMWGQAFRAPAFIELYGINPVASSNPNLKPESIDTWEAALSWHARKDLQVNLNLFHYAVQDVIRTVPNLLAGTGATFQNSGSQHGSGMELEFTWEARPSLRLSAHHAYQRSIDETSGQDAGYAPRQHLYARADWRWQANWLLSGQLNHVADRRRAVGDTRPPVADYTTVDLTLRSDHGLHDWNVEVSLRNLFNADVREPSLAPGTVIPNDLPMAPRALTLQVIHAL